MDQKLRNLQRLSGSDLQAKERYIRELERLVGMGEDSEVGRLKCIVNNCPNRANQGGGEYLMMQNNVKFMGQAPYTWDEALGPFFICGPCFLRMKKSKDNEVHPAYILEQMQTVIGVTGIQYTPID